MKKSELNKIIKEEIHNVLNEQFESGRAANERLYKFLDDQHQKYISEGYKPVKGFQAAGIKTGTSAEFAEGSYLGGYVVTFRFEGYPGEFLFLIENGIRGRQTLHGPWNFDNNDLDFIGSYKGKNIPLGQANRRRPDDQKLTRSDFAFGIVAETSLLYKR